MRSFQEEIFGPVIGVTTFKDEAEALEIANQTQFGLGAGVWTRDSNLAYRMGRGLKPVACGPTAITSTRPMPRSAAINSQASAAKPIKWPLMPINRRKTCW
jgi:aldehyde dehydrogenase